jgi:aminocarboxymuconate-semialdehyde decarboxylase
MLIDIHTHLVPYTLPADPGPEKHARWPCLQRRDSELATLELDGRAFRELDARSWSLARRIEDMDRDHIAVQVLSPMPELLAYWFAPRAALELARHVNHAIADMVARAPTRVRGLGSVPLQDVALATRELARLKQDGLSGVEIGSNINGVLPGDARFNEFYAEAECLELALFVHALHPYVGERLDPWPDLVPFVGFPLDTGLAGASLVRAQLGARFPRLRVVLSHGGGALLPLILRMQHGFEVTAGFGGAMTMAPRELAGRFFYDSLVYDAVFLDYLALELAPGRICAGSDYPYPIQQANSGDFLARTSHCRDAATTQAATRFLGSESPP